MQATQLLPEDTSMWGEKTHLWWPEVLKVVIDRKQVFLLYTVTHQLAKGKCVKGSVFFSVFKDFLV